MLIIWNFSATCDTENKTKHGSQGLSTLKNRMDGIGGGGQRGDGLRDASIHSHTSLPVL